MLPRGGRRPPPAVPIGRFQLPSRRCVCASARATAAVKALGATPSSANAVRAYGVPAMNPPAGVFEQILLASRFPRRQRRAGGMLGERTIDWHPVVACELDGHRGEALVMAGDTGGAARETGARGLQLRHGLL